MSDKTIPNMSGLILGSVDERRGEIYDARSDLRAGAMGAFAREWGVDFTEVACRTRYARWLTRQEQWEGWGIERWEENWEPPDDDDDAEAPDAPDHVPAGWEADDEFDPVWAFCTENHPRAVKVYCCEPRERA